MSNANRRLFLSTLAAGSGVLAVAAKADGDDGHARGHDVAAAEPARRMATIPRKAGEAPLFTASLDGGPIKATSGGWAREVTTRQLPIATGIAGAHLFVGPGGLREMHWHNSAEWAYVMDGHCQLTIIDPEDGETEVVNLAPGDLWYFPAGHAHSVQTIGPDPCHAILAFNDGLYGEHGTFGLTDWISRLDPGLMSEALGQPPTALAAFPRAETYIIQGPVLRLDGPEARATHELSHTRTHRHRMMATTPAVTLPGGTIHIASAKEFPRSADMTGLLLRLAPGATHAPHWHPNANEWMYVAEGRIRVTLLGTDKHLAVAELSPGECAYLPKGCGHTVENIGSERCEIIGATDNGKYVEATLSDWFARAPQHTLAANLGVSTVALPKSRRRFERIVMRG